MQQDGKESTHSFTWLENRIEFRSVYDDSAESWTYTGEDVPQAGNENARINLWLMSGESPSDDEEAEIVIKKFEYIPLPQPGDVSGDDTVSAYDAALVFQHIRGQITLSADQIERGDVNGESDLTADDARLILKKVVGLVDEF